MTDRIHDDEPDTSEGTVRALLSAQCPHWADLDLTYLRTSGTDNAMWRVHVPAADDVVVRLPRRARAAATVDREVGVVRAVTGSPLAGLTRTPEVRHVGEPSSEFPHRWSVLAWLQGVDAWTARESLDEYALAVDLARAVHVIGELTDVPAPKREPGERGGPVGPVLDVLGRWLDDPRWQASSLIDVAAVRRCMDATRETADDEVPIRFAHGDLIPGNVLLADGRLAAIIDWGSAGYGDSALDLVPAWSILDRRARELFREATAADAPSWLRARAFALEQAVGGVLYYTPRRHPLGDVMARTLRRVLDA